MRLADLLDDEVRDSYSVRIPSYVLVSKKQQKAVNLNVYRNLHHHHLNTQKKNFAEEVKPLLRDKPRAEKIWIHYEIFAPRNGRLDTMNVGSIADKYFSDTLVEAGKIPDDSKEYVVLCTFSFGGVVPMDGHVIATVNILDEEKETEDMRILLDENDIQTALDAYVKTLNFPNASTASVEISVNDEGDIEAEVVMGGVKPKNKGGRPRGSKNKNTSAPKEEVKDDVAETGEDGSEGSSDDADSGGDQPSEKPAESGEKESPKAGGKGNLFGDSEEKASSDSQTTTEATEETGPPKVKTKKSSIFDVD